MTSTAEAGAGPIAAAGPFPAGRADDAVEVTLSPMPLPAVSLDHPPQALDDGPSALPAPACDPAPALAAPLATAVAGGKTFAQWQDAHRRLEIVRAYRTACGVAPDASLDAAVAAGRPVNRSLAADILRQVGVGESRSSLDRYERLAAAGGLAALVDNHERSGRRRTHSVTQRELAALKAARLITNRTELDGSSPEAVRLAARRGQLRPELVQALEERDRTGAMVPRWLHQRMVSGAAATKQHRNPTDAGLDYLSAPGALMWLTDERTGARRFIKAGDIFEADDATINFPVCVPWDIGGDPCAERYGVRVARFQWLVAIDRASRFVPGYRYTARPRSSYRAEDVAGLFQGIFRQHGIWQRACLERGIWESGQITELLRQLGIERITAWSPHQKPFIEGLFNSLWTKLSDLPGQVGRFRGEEEESGRVLTSCQRGATDPRLHFPMLADAIAGFDTVIAEHNRETVKSPQWGRWVPQERWLAQQGDARAAGRLRELPAESAWLFAPCVREWTVKGNTVGGLVQLMEGLSVPYEFSAAWLVDYVGCKVRCHFDPFAPRTEAAVVLVNAVREHRAGELLGTATQINVTAAEARRRFGFGDDADLGLRLRRETSIGLRAEVRATLAGGGGTLSITTARDADGNGLTLERGVAPVPAAAPARPVNRRDAALTPPAGRRGTNPFAATTPEDFSARAALRERKAAASREAELVI